MNLAMLAAFICYMLTLIGIGIWASKKSRPTAHSTDFIVGNRSINYWVTAISAHAADMSDWLFMAFPAAIYMQGSFNIWIAIGLVLGMLMTWQFIAPVLHRATAKYDSTTLTGYFETKYNETSGRISVLSSIIMAFFFTVYLAAGIKGAGYLLNSSFGINYYIGAGLSVAVSIFYALIGGYVAAAWVDFFQGIFLLVAVVITPIIGYFAVGGSSAIVAAAAQKNISLSLIPDFHAFVGILLQPIVWGLGYFGMPHILSKFMGAQNADEMYKSKYIGITWQIIALTGATLSGFVGLAFFTAIEKPELLFITMTQTLFPAFITGLILCGILAATLSTMNSQILVLAGVIANDLYKKYTRPHATNSDVLFVFNASILLVSLFAFCVSLNQQGTIFGLVQFAWGGLGASFGPLTLLSLYYSHINRHGAFWGIIAGGTTAVVWKYFNPLIWGLSVNEMGPGFLVGLVTIVIVSHLTAHKNN